MFSCLRYSKHHIEANSKDLSKTFSLSGTRIDSRFVFRRKFDINDPQIHLKRKQWQIEGSDSLKESNISASFERFSRYTHPGFYHSVTDRL